MEVLSPVHILSNLSDLREEGLLCDIELQVEGEMISVHRALLASVSPYFKALFTREFKEVNQDVIEIKEVSFLGMRLVIDCCYTSRLQLNPDNLYDILSAANHVQVNKIVDSCKKFMTDNLNEANCILFLGLAEIFSFEDVQREANDYILRNFTAVRKTEEFKKLPKEKMIQYLNHDELNVNQDETEAFYAAQDWLETDPERLEYVDEVIKTVRFHVMDLEQLTKIASTDLIDDRKKCRALIREVMLYQSKVLEFPLIDDIRTRRRGRQGVFITESIDRPEVTLPDTTEGWESGTDCKVFLFSLNKGKEIQPFRIGSFVRNSIRMVQLNNYIFMFAALNDTLEQVASRYDPGFHEWIDLKPRPNTDQTDTLFPQAAAVGSSIAVLDGHIYLLGGMLVTCIDTLTQLHYAGSRDRISDRISSYDIARDKWHEQEPLPEGLAFSAAVGCPSNGCIYLCGGVSPDNDGCANLYAYDTSSNIWLTKPRMEHSRYAHCMGLVHDKIYVIGGYYDEGQIEIFDVIEEQWTTVESLRLNVYNSCALVMDEDILILGGSGPDFQPTSDIRVFHTDDHTVTMHEKCLPEPIAFPVGALIVHPALL